MHPVPCSGFTEIADRKMNEASWQHSEILELWWANYSHSLTCAQIPNIIWLTQLLLVRITCYMH